MGINDKRGTGRDSGYHWGLQISCNARFQTIRCSAAIDSSLVGCDPRSNVK